MPSSPVRSAVVAQAAVLMLFLLTACGGGGTTNPGTGGTGGLFKATIDGASWTSNSSTASASTGGNFTLTGTQIGATITTISMTLYSIGGPGTYPVGVTSTVAGGTSSVTTGSTTWFTPLSGAAGTVTISAVSPTRIAGTFNYAATPSPGLTGTTRTVTSGQFDLPVVGPATLVVPDGAASKVTGTVAGNDFNAATVVKVTAPSSGTLSIGASNTTYNINFIISGYTGVGSYTLGAAGLPFTRTIQVVATSPVKAWGGSNPSTSGTLVVQSATATRIKGTFSATLTSQSDGAIVLSGTFELGLP